MTTETDRELLELAAKAAGIVPKGYEDNADYIDGLLSGRNPWNPLTDDGDALRLAVKLRIGIEYYHPVDAVKWVQAVDQLGRSLIDEEYEDDSQADAATRRAIVRAAAEIGRAMP